MISATPFQFSFYALELKNISDEHDFFCTRLIIRSQPNSFHEEASMGHTNVIYTIDSEKAVHILLLWEKQRPGGACMWNSCMALANSCNQSRTLMNPHRVKDILQFQCFHFSSFTQRHFLWSVKSAFVFSAALPTFPTFDKNYNRQAKVESCSLHIMCFIVISFFFSEYHGSAWVDTNTSFVKRTQQN